MPVRFLDEEQKGVVPAKRSIRFLDEEPALDNMRPQGNAGGAARAAAYGFSGGNIPFGNVITSGLGAAIAKAASPLTGDERTLRELYDQAQADTKATQDAHKLATLAGNVAGAVSTLPAAFSKGGAATLAGVKGETARKAITGGAEKIGEYAGKVANFSPFAKSGVGNAATRFAGRSVLAAPVAGAYSAGDADSGERGEAFGKGAALGVAASAAVPAGFALGAGLLKGSKNIVTGIKARSPDVLNDALSGMKEFSRNLYRKSESSGAVLTPQAAQKISNSVSNIVKNSNTGASQTLYSKTIAAIKGLNEDIANGNTGLETLDAHRQILGNLAKDITNPNRMQEAEAAGRAIDEIDSIIENLSPADIQNQSREAIESLLQARKVWSQSKKFEKIASIVENAGGDANKLKRDLDRFAANKKNTLGWSDDEKQALKFAAEQTTGEGLLKMFGKFGFDLGSGRAIGNTALPIIGGYIAGGGGGAIAASALGTAARQGQKYLARGKTELLLDALEKSTKNQPQATPVKQTPSIAQNLANAIGVSRAGFTKKPSAPQAINRYIKKRGK